MLKYFFYNGDVKEGPIVLDELKRKDIKPNTLIWHEGLENWQEANSFDELREIFELRPPTLDKEIKDTDKKDTEELVLEGNLNKRQDVFSNPFSFNGRIRRSEYIISLGVVIIINTVLNSLVEVGQIPLIGLAYIPNLWFLFAQGSKRCHDEGKSGWYQLIPFYVFSLIFTEGGTGRNKYGNNPKK